MEDFVKYSLDMKLLDVQVMRKISNCIFILILSKRKIIQA